jgi:hypothetical protein
VVIKKASLTFQYSTLDPCKNHQFSTAVPVKVIYTIG